MSASFDHGFHALSKRFEAFGIEQFCYIKHANRHGCSQYEVYGADGTYLWGYPDRATADAALRQHDMEPLSLH